ncbi:DUF1295 domain-containing protein [Nocardioides sp.]|uniref:DUF1295 domain-containing protein n=1 Tax=Nocardioides sp. TaxID=35761 RepID=UPI00356327D7
MTDIVLILLTGLATAAFVMTLTAAISRHLGRVAVVDIAWGLGFVAIALTTALAGDAGDDRRWLVLGLVSVWGLRLAWHIRRRAVGHGEDPRYEAMLGGPVAEVGFAVAVRKVFLVQGVALWVISLPVQVGAVRTVEWWPVVVAGSALWLVGLLFESIGDAQLAAYKADPDRGPVMDRGLWAWTRHPNYFGDACVWWGIWLVGGLASGWLVGLVTVIAPLAMTYFLLFTTGARLLEKTMMQREGYPAYAERTSFFFPLPPRGRHG